MKIVFLGTPDFAVPSLEALIEAGHDVQMVITQPDRPKGRTGQPQPPPVKRIAQARGIPVFQPESVNSEDAASKLASLKPDALVVAAFGQILRPAVLDLPPYGCLNVHGSLLPAYRGAAPIPATQPVQKALDAGYVLNMPATPIPGIAPSAPATQPAAAQLPQGVVANGDGTYTHQATGAKLKIVNGKWVKA